VLIGLMGRHYQDVRTRNQFDVLVVNLNILQPPPRYSSDAIWVCSCSCRR